MKQGVLFLVYLLSCCLLACKPSVELSEIEHLDLSIEDKIELAQSGEELEVEVTTRNGSKWFYLGGTDWLSLKQRDNKLVLVGLANETIAKRSSMVVVRSGQLSRSFLVEQKGKNQVLEAKEYSYTIDQWGDEIAFIVRGELDQLDVINSASNWVQFQKNPRKKEFRIIVSENRDYTDRKATLYLRDALGNGESKVLIEQKSAMYHILPYGGFHETEEEISEFEKGRRSVLVGKPTGVANPLVGGNSNLWTFETKSKIFNIIQYIVEPDERQYRAAIAWATDPRLFTRSEELDKVSAFLLKEGFVLRRGSTYYSEKHECQAVVGVTQEGSFIMYTFEPRQTKAQPTFNYFPWGIIENVDWRSYDVAKVSEWERNNGGTYVTEDEEDEKVAITYKTDDLGGYLRIYTFNIVGRTLESVQHVFPSIDQIFFHDRGATVMTKEFLELVRKEKFDFLRYLDAHIFLFEHKARTLYMGAYRTSVVDPDDEDQELIVAKLEFLSTTPPSGGSDKATQWNSMVRSKRDIRTASILKKVFAK